MTPFSSVNLSGAQLVLFLDAILSFGCSDCAFIGLWPFKGLFHAWMYKKHAPYNWQTHTMMAWFDVGCIGLLTTNIFAYLKFTESTSVEAFELVYTTNFIMHLLWGVHNLHLFLCNFYQKGSKEEWRRSYVILCWSLFGACGSGAFRNYYSLKYGPDDSVTKITWVVEWISLGIIMGDLFYFLLKEHGHAPYWEGEINRNNNMYPSSELLGIDSDMHGFMIETVRLISFIY